MCIHLFFVQGDERHFLPPFAPFFGVDPHSHLALI